MDPVGGAAAAYAIMKAASRVLGPASDEVAESFRRWTAVRVGNTSRIVKNAEAKVADPESPGAVPMRVMMQVAEDGSYSDEGVVVEYLGGVLASSRTEEGRDD